MIADLKASLTEGQLVDWPYYERNLERMNSVVEHIKPSVHYDQLKRSFIYIETYPEPLFEIGIYENFKINSLHLIQNDSLKTAVINFMRRSYLT
jgi:hypothetical protein